MAFIKFSAYGQDRDEALANANAKADAMGYSEIIVDYCGQCKNQRWMVIFTCR